MIGMGMISRMALIITATMTEKKQEQEQLQ
jgi:hypothetical protein